MRQIAFWWVICSFAKIVVAGIHDCESGPCQNQGVCIAYYNAPYSCYCPSNWFGVNCEIPNNQICETANPCENMGTCYDGYYSNYTCICLTGWTGDNCTIPPPDCEGVTTCGNHGLCACQGHNNYYVQNGHCIDGITCACEPYYSGDHCLIYSTACDSNPCRHGGICTNTQKSFSCDCTGTGFSGPTCGL